MDRNDPMLAVGLMSGTSMDGIDAALIRTDGEHAVERLAFRSDPYEEAFRHALVEAIGEASGLADRAGRTPLLSRVEAELTALNAAAVGRLLDAAGVAPEEVGVVGFHGHTVLHAPDRRLTVQLGNGQALAHAVGIDVVYDLRAADCAAGGEGAPLSPIYHRALAMRLPERPAAFLNIGGVANVTWVSSGGLLMAFDTGPGNALIDDWLKHHTGQPLDEDGRLAAGGTVDEDALRTLMGDPYFGRVPPKSLDRNAFSLDPVRHLAPADGAATLTAFTAASIAAARAHFPEQPAMWVVCGGGRRNRTLMGMLAGRVEAAVAPIEATGHDGDAIEAEAWAYLAVRSLRKLPISYPGTTGVRRPMTGGVLARKG
ncbi:MAG: anhydro-N-acetylmuramic acid kinase [Hyphomicrobiaceae bacterium]|nr:anhydro-N-acetylmuramic acid kinase [Hyphomicrobiaceae bacterium]